MASDANVDGLAALMSSDMNVTQTLDCNILKDALPSIQPYVMGGKLRAGNFRRKCTHKPTNIALFTDRHTTQSTSD